MLELCSVRRHSCRRVAWAAPLLLLLLGVCVFPSPARAQSLHIVAEQWLLGSTNGALVSASLDPGRRYSLQILSVGEPASFRGSYSQNWFTREGARRAGSNEGSLVGRGQWETELVPPAQGLTQWTFAASVWNEGAGPLVLRLLDLGPR